MLAFVPLAAAAQSDRIRVYFNQDTDPAVSSGTLAISLHQAIEKPHDSFFRDAEPIFLAHGGRPHWGKLQYLTATQVANLYPDLPAFEAIRREMDPAGIFVNGYLQELGFGS